MYMGKCFNFANCDDFVLFDNTKEKLIDRLVNFYTACYNMDANDALEMGYESMRDYVIGEKGVEIYEIRTDGVYLDGTFRTDDGEYITDDYMEFVGE